MANLLKIALWNANGATQHALEIKSFINEHKIDILLISETHFTNKSYFSIRNYTTYDTKHPDGKAHGGSAIIIKNTIKHYELQKYEKEYLQATSVVVEDWIGTITISALYSPPKHSISKAQYLEYYKTLGKRFIAGGDYNAKHTHWGSRTITHKGRQLLLAMQEYKLNYLSTGHPTYWPTDPRKVPDLIDFCITRGIDDNHMKAESCLDLSSDHSPVIITASTKIISRKIVKRLHTKHTDWTRFKEILDSRITLNIPLSSENNISEAIEKFNNVLVHAANESTPEQKNTERQNMCPTSVKLKIEEKRKLRKVWQRTRAPIDKMRLNKATKEIKTLLNNVKNESLQNYLLNLSATEVSDYSLWRATKKLKRPQQHIPPVKRSNGEWARTDMEKANAFAEHLQETFKPYPSQITNEQNSDIINFLDAPFQMNKPIKKFSVREVAKVIRNEVNPKKTPGYDLVTGKMLQELTQTGIKYLTYIINAILRMNYYPDCWKVAQIILIPKPGKDLNKVDSYRPISLLPIMSKVFEKLLIQRLKPLLVERKLIPHHQFGFREKHSTIEQVHRVVYKINTDLEEKRYCSAAFLDITQAFDKVWHEGLLYKIKKALPHHFYQILQSYLGNRKFMVKQSEEVTPLYDINSGVPQGSVLGPVLYLLHTSDLPVAKDTLVATFADDTAILASNENPVIASRKLQESLDSIQKWLQTWRIKANENKSVHITFTNRRGVCPAVQLNNTKLPQKESAKYLGLHLDRRLTWKTHVQNKSKQLRLKVNKMYWLIGRRSQLALESKILLYKAILMPVWTYGIELWGTTSKSNIEVLERFQAKVLRTIVNAPWYVKNEVIRRDLKIHSVKEAVTVSSKRYFKRLREHPNILANGLLSYHYIRRLKRHNPSDLPTRFGFQ